MGLWGRKSSTETLKAYVSAINSADLAKVGELMADDMLLVDTSEDEMRGRNNCLELVQSLFSVSPEYRLQIDSYTPHGDDVLMTGTVTSSFRPLGQATHFRARADHSKVYEWHSYSMLPARALASLMAAKRQQADAAE